VNSEPSCETRVPASSLRVAIATLSPDAGSLPTSQKETRPFPAFKGPPPVVLSFAISVS
jgi:hypothetical protein